MTTPAFRAVRLLVGAYLTLSVLTVVAVIVLSRWAPSQVNDQAWVRGIIVAATAVLTFVFARRAAQGRPRALLRLRIVVVIILVTIVGVLLFVSLPAWMKVEQAVCGALLLATAAIIFGDLVAPQRRSSSRSVARDST
jgi:phosphatidylserine synthase